MSSFDYIQTFYVNPSIVGNAPEVMLTSVDLFFKSKPVKNANISGLANPGIIVWLCEIVNDKPRPQRTILNSVKAIEYDLINASSDAQTATTIGFTDPVVLKTAKFYGIAIKYSDPAFDIWTNKQGDRLVAPGGVTNQPSPGAQGRFDGYLYKSTSTNYQKFTNRDLKFKVKVAKFTSDTSTFSLVNKDYEFFTVDNSSLGGFVGGEWVYQNVANATGTITVSSASRNIVGSGTTLTNYKIGDRIVFKSGGATDVVTVTNIVNTTFMSVNKRPDFSASAIGFKVPPIGRTYYTDYTKKRVYLVDSNANSSVLFVPGTRIIGARSGASANIASIDRFQVDNFKPTFMIGNPSTSSYQINYKMANTSNSLPSTATKIDLLKFNNAPRKSFILSRSLEVNTSVSSSLFGTNRKSAVANVVVSVATTNQFAVPYLNTAELDFYMYQNDVNDDYTATRGGITNYDTEVDRNGLAKSKYISKKISFGEGKYAEDLVVYLAGYRPAKTEIRVYAKLHNAADKEAFDDKAWTPLRIINNIDRYSSDDPKDIIEYTYGLPQYPEVYSTLSGSFITQASNTVVTTSADQSSVLDTGDLIKIANPLTPEDNHEVFPVASVNSTAIVLYREVSNTNIVGDVTIDKLKYKNVAWNNIGNDNVARYVTSSYVEFDTFSTMQIKVVMLANSTHIVPRVEQIQAIGVSA